MRVGSDDEFDDDEATMPAASENVAQIRAEADRIRTGDFEADADPTTVMSADPDLADEPTIITGFDRVDPTTTIDAFAEGEPTAGFEADADPTTVMVPPATSGDSLISGKAPPAASADYWSDAENSTAASATTGKGPMPRWFLVSSLMAVAMAVGLVVLVLWALAGST